MRTGTVRTCGCATSSGRMSRSDDAGGAAIAEGASARGGAGMNEAGRGFSVESHAAAGAPFECTRGRARRPRFFSGSGVARRAAGGGGRTIFAAVAGFAGFAATLGAGFAGFAGFAALTGFATTFAAFTTAFFATLATFFAVLAAFLTFATTFFAGAFLVFDLAGFAGFAGFFGAIFFLPAFAAFFTFAATFFAAFLLPAAFFFFGLAMRGRLRAGNGRNLDGAI